MTSHAFPLAGPIKLHVRLGQGGLTVNAVDDCSEARVTLTALGKNSHVIAHSTVAMNGSTVEVVCPHEGGGPMGGRDGRKRATSVAAEITVPSGTAVRLTSSAADITVVGRTGRADIATDTGRLAVGEIDGDLRLHLGSGSSRVERISGSATVRCGSGDAFFGEIVGDLQGRSGGGELRAGVVRGGSRLRSGSGNVHIDAVYGDVDFRSGSGQLSLGLPADISAQVDVRTGSGQVRSELQIDNHRKGTGPEIAVRAHSGSGDLRLFRAAAF